jgi:hypothetical protein
VAAGDDEGVAGVEGVSVRERDHEIGGGDGGGVGGDAVAEGTGHCGWRGWGPRSWGNLCAIGGGLQGWGRDGVGWWNWGAKLSPQLGVERGSGGVAAMADEAKPWPPRRSWKLRFLGAKLGSFVYGYAAAGVGAIDEELGGRVLGLLRGL